MNGVLSTGRLAVLPVGEVSKARDQYVRGWDQIILSPTATATVWKNRELRQEIAAPPRSARRNHQLQVLTGGLRESGASVQPHVDGMATKQGESIVCIITLGRTTLLTRFTATYEYFPTILRNVEGNLARRTGTLGIGQSVPQLVGPARKRGKCFVTSPRIIISTAVRRRNQGR